MAIVKVIMVMRPSVNKTYSVITIIILFVSMCANGVAYVSISQIEDNIQVMSSNHSGFWFLFITYSVGTLTAIVSLL